MSREKGCALFLVFALTMAVAPDAMAKKKKSSGTGEPSESGSGRSKAKAGAATLTSGGGADSIERGDKFYGSNSYYMASIEYNKAIEDQGGDELSRQAAEFKMGKTLYKLHFFSAAISSVDRIVQKGTAHPHYNETLQWLAALTRDVPESAGVLERIGKYDRSELDHLDDLARYGDNRVLESTVDRWYELSGQMILSDPPLQDSRSECVNEGKWIKIFKERVSSANSPIPEILLRHLHRPTLLVRQPNLQIVYNCLSEVADVVLNKRPDLQEQFLHVAINTCKLAPGLGWKLLTTVVEIVAKDPVKRLPLLPKFIQPMSAEHRDVLFRDVHRTVNEWVDQQTDKRCEAQLRRDQADLVPYLLGHRKRDLRLSTLKSTSRVEALVRVLDNQGRPIEISGEVRDVSNGIGDGRGSGIHIHAEDWSFLPIGGPHPFPPREIMAKSLKDDSVACFSTASVEL